MEMRVEGDATQIAESGSLSLDEHSERLAPLSRGASPLLFFAVPFSTTGTFVWTWTDLGKPIVLPAGAQHGFAIRFDVNARATVEMKLHVSIEWLEV